MKRWLTIEEYKRRKTAEAEADMERIEFLEKLDASEIMLSDWETEFIESYMQARSEGREQRWFTEGRRRSTDKMRDYYAEELWEKNGSRWQRHGPTSSPHQVEIPEANTDGCMYLVRGENGLQTPCNEPATCQTRAGFRYCETHRQIAAEACKHKKTSLVTIPINRRNAETQRL